MFSFKAHLIFENTFFNGNVNTKAQIIFIKKQHAKISKDQKNKKVPTHQLQTLRKCLLGTKLLRLHL